MKNILSQVGTEADIIIEINPGDITKDSVISFMDNLGFGYTQISVWDYHFTRNNNL
jgi:hypothetical protein